METVISRLTWSCRARHDLDTSRTSIVGHQDLLIDDDLATLDKCSSTNDFQKH